MSSGTDIENIMRILVATDNHLGYAERDQIRGEDSFTSFEEILELAVSEDVDAILLGGDLFHDAEPSQNTLNKCMAMLRRYTFGDKPVNLEFLSDQTVNFHSAINQTANYCDPNLNVSIPVFSIHGNHDDPSGYGCVSSLDLLSSAGLINYFGRWTDLTQVEIEPLRLRKGETKLALYGLSHIHDARLARLFEDGKVVMNRPDPEKAPDWFYMLVLHQNHAERGPKNYIPEEMLPKFFDLVIWGHEHDCHIEALHNPKTDFYVSQPGSSVATSLAEGEALPKHVALLQIYKTKFQLQPLPLKTVRPFVFESINVDDLVEELNLDEGDASNKVRQMAEERIEAMIERAKSMLTDHPKQPKIPLIRLRIVYSKEEYMFNGIRFGQMYNERVANPTDIISFKKIPNKKYKNDNGDFDKEAMENAFKNIKVDATARVEDLIERYFEDVGEEGKLKLFNAKVLSELCFRLVERNDNTAADNILKYYQDKALEHLMETLPAEDKVAEELLIFKDNYKHEDLIKYLDEGDNKKVKSDTKITAASTKRQQQQEKNAETINILDDDYDDYEEMPLSSMRKNTTRGGLRNAKDDNSSSPTKTTKATRGSRGGRGRVASATKTTATTSRARANTTRSTHKMQALNVSIENTRSKRQTTLLDAVNGAKNDKRKIPVYEICDSDSD